MHQDEYPMYHEYPWIAKEMKRILLSTQLDHNNRTISTRLMKRFFPAENPRHVTETLGELARNQKFPLDFYDPSLSRHHTYILRGKMDIREIIRERDQLRTAIDKALLALGVPQVESAKDQNSREDNPAQSCLVEQLRSALDALSPREATIMAMRFGFYDGSPHTLDEIGRALGMTRERVDQLETQSISKILMCDPKHHHRIAVLQGDT